MILGMRLRFLQGKRFCTNPKEEMDNVVLKYSVGDLGYTSKEGGVFMYEDDSCSDAFILHFILLYVPEGR